MRTQRAEAPSERNRHADLLIGTATAFATTLGVELGVEYDAERDRISFILHRNDAPKGSGAQALRRLLTLADDAGFDVVLDVMESEPRLVRFYWDFGFRMADGDPASEHAALTEMTAARTRFLLDSRYDPVDFGVTFMDRARGAGPLGPEPS